MILAVKTHEEQAMRIQELEKKLAARIRDENLEDAVSKAKITGRFGQGPKRIRRTSGQRWTINGDY